MADEDTLPTATAADYEAARMAAIPEIYKSKHERLACELAWGMEEPAPILERYGFTIDEGMALLQEPAFLTMLARIEQEVRTSGLSFRMKARAQAEEFLATNYAIVTDPLAPYSVRAEQIRWTTKVAALEPLAAKDDAKTGGGFSLSITFAGQAPVKVVQGGAALIEQT